MPALITAEDIKEIRKRYGLSQKSFALLLGIGPATIVRYEQGATPTKANANLIRAARNPQFMQECLEADGHLIPERQRVVAEQIIYDYVSFDDEENAVMHEGLPVSGEPSSYTMDELYHFTLQQEILNEQAANLIGTLMRLSMEREKEGQLLGEPVELLLQQLFEVKNQITARGSDDDVLLEQIRGYLTYQEEYVAQLCGKELVA